MERIIQGDCLDVLKEMPDNSIDAVVTDPPYGLSKEPDIREVLTKWMAGEDYHHRGGGFMGKTWDSFVPGPSIWREVFRVLKPGGHVLCFAGTRTQDLMTISLRMAGFEIRDVIEWLYFSGFPKSMDVSKAFDKRAGAEREVLGVATHIHSRGKATSFPKRPGETTVEESGRKTPQTAERALITAPATELAKKYDGFGTALKPAHEPIIMARKPLEGTVCDNVEKYGTGAINIDGCRIPSESIKIELSLAHRNNNYGRGEGGRGTKEEYVNDKGRFPANCITTEPDMFYSKYFNVTPEPLCKKASKKDRNSDWRGETINRKPQTTDDGRKKPIDNPFLRGKTERINSHPTVKPTDLMAWLIRLITPPGGTVLDPFAGSGSTLVAAKREGFSFIGIDRESEYIEIARARAGVEETA